MPQKTRLFIGLILFGLLAACGTEPGPTDTAVPTELATLVSTRTAAAPSTPHVTHTYTPIPVTRTRSPMPTTEPSATATRTLAPVTVGPTSTPISLGPIAAEQEYLIYFQESWGTSENDQRLYMYILAEERSSPILQNWTVGWFAISSQNRLAFNSNWDNQPSTYILDYPFNENEPRKIIHPEFQSLVPLSWSPAGNLLALLAYDAYDRGYLIVWDGGGFQTIFEHEFWWRGLEWSVDGRLAFSGSYLEDQPDEIFYWDGVFTSNLSQNINWEDRAPSWSADGRLAFVSGTGDGYNLLVWDGIATRLGIPDANTFEQIGAGLTDWYTTPDWNNADQLTFDYGRDIYTWDGTLLNSKTYTIPVATYDYGPFGLLALDTFYGGNLNGTFVYDSEGQLIFHGNSTYADSAWSAQGQLLFCARAERGWSIKVWNREIALDVATSGDIVARWPGSKLIWCSSG